MTTPPNVVRLDSFRPAPVAPTETGPPERGTPAYGLWLNAQADVWDSTRHLDTARLLKVIAFIRTL